MRFQILQHTTKRLLRNAAIVAIAGFGAGCSADTMRFTDGIFTGSTNSNPQPMAQPAQPGGGYYSPRAAAAPIAAAPSAGRVQRSSLTSVSSAPLAAPVAAARQSVQAPIAAAGQMPGQIRNQVQNQVQGQVQNQVGAAQTKLASAATATHDSVTGAKEKVLGQMPVAAGQAAVGAVPAVAQMPAVKKLPGATEVASAGAALVSPKAAAGGYTVQNGDSLFSIAQKNNVPLDQLKKANGLTNGSIRVGQTLVMPGAAAAGAAVTQVAAVTPQPANPAVAAKPVPAAAAGNVKPYTPPQSDSKVIEDAESDKAEAPSATGISQMRWPVRGKVLASYGQRDGGTTSDGMDIMVPEGTAVKAAENGVVIYAGDGLKEFGNTILVRHDNGLVTVYGHNSQNLVQRGQKVRRGEEIAKSGMSGNAKQPKLHFEVRKNSTPVNPNKYLEG